MSRERRERQRLRRLGLWPEHPAAKTREETTPIVGGSFTIGGVTIPIVGGTFTEEVPEPEPPGWDRPGEN
jgi:hypothetical protein